MKITQFRTGPISVNTYIVYNEDTKEGFIVDPGGNYKRIVKEIFDADLKIKAQLLTHGHFDHCGASKPLQDDGIPVYIHKKDADKLCTEANLARHFGLEFETLKSDRQLSDGEEVEVAGFKIKILHTPGHTSGSACYVVENCIFTGDTLFNMSVGRTDLGDGDSAALHRSITEKLFALDGDYQVYPGHDETTTLDYERNFNPYVEYGAK